MTLIFGPLCEAMGLCKSLVLVLNPVLGYSCAHYHPLCFLPTHLESAKEIGTRPFFFSQGPTHSKHSIFIFQLSSCPQPESILSNEQQGSLALYLIGSFPNILAMP